MIPQRTMFPLVLLSLTCLLASGAAEAGERWPSSELLLPCFEVRLDGSPSLPPSLTTFFAVVNSSPQEVPITIEVRSNWGLEIEEIETSLILQPYAVEAINLGTWILNASEHVRLALCGESSEDLYFSTPMDISPPPRAVGSVLIRTQDDGADVLWGDYFVVEPGADFAQGEVLVNLDAAVVPGAEDDDDLCSIHALRFLEGGSFDGGTELMIWNRFAAGPSSDSAYPGEKVPAVIDAFAESGELLATFELDLEPLEAISVCDDLGLCEFGWLRVDTSPVDTFIAVRYSALDRFSVGMETFCLPVLMGPSVRIEKSTNGEDADSPPGPWILVGDPVSWEYRVTNTSGEDLSGLLVTDDQGVEVSCPDDFLAVGESMTCTASGVAVAGQYANCGRVDGDTGDGTPATDTDCSHYWGGEECEDEPEIEIEKATNGEDADSPPGPAIPAGGAVTWTYDVANTGNVALANVGVTDDQGVVVDCPSTGLDPGQSMTCIASGTAVVGPYQNLGTVTATSVPSPDCAPIAVADEDLSHYQGWECEDEPEIEIEKATNGEDADSPPGPAIPAGGAVTWTYDLANTGNVALANVAVTDDRGVVVDCPSTGLDPGQSMTCIASGTAVVGPYQNLATVTATSVPSPDCAPIAVADEDLSHYQGWECEDEPEIEIEKATNGEDADSPPGPAIPAGGAVTWTYDVANTGNVALANVAVTDDRGVVVDCPSTGLDPGQSMTCIAGGTAVLGPYQNLGTVSAISVSSPDCDAIAVVDEDPSHYLGEEGEQGCTPGYWKNHLDSWEPAGYLPEQSVMSVFGAAMAYPDQGSASLLEALSFGGGPGVEGAAEILLRAAVAALLNGAHDGVHYPRTVGGVIDDVDAALASADRDAMLLLAAALDADNNLGCPLN